MGYFEAWKVLEEMLVSFKTKGMVIPDAIMSDLRSIKTFLNILKADSNRLDAYQKIEEYFLNVESYLVSEGQKMFGVEPVESWIRKIEESRKLSDVMEKKQSVLPRLPRGQSWVRVLPSHDFPIEKLKELATKLRLSILPQKDGHFMVFGEERLIKDYIRRMALRKSEVQK